MCAGPSMGTPKPRILPWLVSQLDLGQLKGVAWLDESRTRFRIPWKHGLRQDAQMADFGIFQVLGAKDFERLWKTLERRSWAWLGRGGVLLMKVGRTGRDRQERISRLQDYNPEIKFGLLKDRL